MIPSIIIASSAFKLISGLIDWEPHFVPLPMFWFYGRIVDTGNSDGRDISWKLEINDPSS